MGPTIYVAGSSREIPRVRATAEALRAAGCVPLDHWVEAVERYGTGGASLTDEERAACARSDTDAIDRADGVLVLWPETPSIGAYVELGYALGRARHDDSGAAVLIVGGESIWHSHVRGLWPRDFCLGGTFATVEEAIEWMRHEMHVCGEWPTDDENAVEWPGGEEA